MIALHAVWNGPELGRLCVWAETSEKKRKRRKDKGPIDHEKRPRCLTHPFCLMADEVRAAVASCIAAAGLPADEFTRDALAYALLLRLPSTADAPKPSPDLIPDDTPTDEAVVGLRAWAALAQAFDPGSALDLLLALPSQPPHGVAYSSSVRFWEEAAKFALELAGRQCFAPTVQLVERAHWLDRGVAFSHAAWEVVLNEEDEKRLQMLVDAMPPVCRSVTSLWDVVSRPAGKKGRRAGKPGPIPDMDPSKLVVGFLNRTVDALVRRSLAPEGLGPGRRHKTLAGLKLPVQWLQGLSAQVPAGGDDGSLMAAPNHEMKSFIDKLQPWLAQARPQFAGAPFRVCFRLDQPETGAGSPTEDGRRTTEDGRRTTDDGRRNSDWRVSFHLQANDDRSLLLPADNVWRARSGVVNFLQRRFENPQERLLADLGRASRLYPDIERSLETACPSDLGLSTEQAYSFLRQFAPLLEQSGFGVLLPPWWQKPNVRLSAKLQVKSPGGTQVTSGLLGLNGIVAYQWQIAIGDQAISYEEFQRLASLKVPLVQVRGQWVELRPDEIEKAIAFFERRRNAGEMPLTQALRLGLGQEMADLGLPVTGIEGEGPVKDLLDQLVGNTGVVPVEAPAGFRGELRPYQARGVSWLAFLSQFGLGACLADDMGLGKTIQLIALMLHERRCGSRPEDTKARNPSLLICPMTIVGNWSKEIERFAPELKVMVHHGAERFAEGSFAERARASDLVITTYALALRDEPELAKVEWDRVVLDEAQNIKTQAARQTQAIKRLPARHRIALTGTPVENRLSELWSIMDFLNHGYLGSAQDFRKRFAVPIEKYRDQTCSAMLKRLAQPYILRRLKTDRSIIKDLPEKQEMKVFCNLTQEQATLYEAVVKEMMQQIEQADGIQRKGLVLSTLMKLKQICNHPAQFVHDGSALAGRSGKLARLEEMLDEVLDEGDRALVFTQFAELGGMLRTHLQDKLSREVLFLHGATPKKQRDVMVQRFQGDAGGPRVFVLSIKAGGLGLNLTAANHVFHFDRWWNPAVENQATDRVFRIGQKKNVQVHKFVCVGTLEERIDRMIEQKKDLADSIVGTGEGWITEMLPGQLKELFALSRTAVGSGEA